MRKLLFLIVILSALNSFSASIHENEAIYQKLNKLVSQQKYPLYYAESFMALCNDWKNTKLMFYVADAYDKLGNLYRERDILNRALKLTPEDKELEKKLKETEERINKIEKKIEFLEQQPEELKVYNQLTAIYIGLKDLSNARKYLNKANNVESSKKEIIHRLMDGAFKNQLEIPTKKAIEFSMEALREYEKGNKEKAYIGFRDALSLSICSPFVYDNLAKMFIQEKNYGGAIRALEESYSIKKEAAKAIDLGNLYFLVGDYTIAFDYFQQATKMNEKASEAYYNIALCLEKLGDKKGAEEYYKIAFAQNPALKKLKNKNKPLFIGGIKIMAEEK